jgi:UDP-N-acetylmuramoyl-L-alanyl-D-glutamate--2,6-diaminopimelate ligase
MDAKDLAGIALDSRRVKPGWLYVALPGSNTHGAQYVPEAIANGAAGVLTDAAGAELAGPVAVPVTVVENPRAEMARIAADFYGRPARKLKMLAVTGTAGKTSTVMLAAKGLRAVGEHVGTIGTLGFFVDDQALPGDRSTVTTPESPDVQALLAQMLDRGATAVAMEATSHALAQHRVDAIEFAVAGFSNLGHDHLDYHHDQESYFRAKARLFTPEFTKRAVINIDDPYGRRLVAGLDPSIAVSTVSMNGEADFRIASLGIDQLGRSELRLQAPQGTFEFTLGLLGSFNVKNALLAAAMLATLDIDLPKALAGLADARLPGRMQRVDLGTEAPYVVVDFAHTPETVEAALTALPPTRRIVVLGCGGERDRLKRAPMGRTAAECADVVVVTDDNPRSEDPQAIRDEVLAGARAAAATSGAEVIDGGERRQAIALALELAKPGEWVAVLGKGHETGQMLADRTIPFDDASVVVDEWNRGK